MYYNGAYLNNSRVDFKDNTRPLVVGSCGTYRLKSHPVLPTIWPRGRLDYQLLYVATGKAHFFFDGKEEIVHAGHMVLYPPCEPQRYTYYASERPEVFWVHFTGYDVKNILEYYSLSPKQHIYYTGTSPEYKTLFRQMILELQMCRPLYEDMLATHLNHIFLLMNRQIQEGHMPSRDTPEEVELALSYFNEHYNTPISIEAYAESRHVSTSGFIRTFKQYVQYVHMTPMQYILSVRIANAQRLLEHTSYNVTEIASIVGYDNPLYFSRIFKQQTGASPAKYRKEFIENKR